MTTTVSHVLYVDETVNRKLQLSNTYDVYATDPKPVVTVFNTDFYLSVDFGTILGQVNSCKFDIGYGSIESPCDYLTFDYGSI